MGNSDRPAFIGVLIGVVLAAVILIILNVVTPCANNNAYAVRRVISRPGLPRRTIEFSIERTK